MRLIAWICVIPLLCAGVAQAETTSFPNGTLNVFWVSDTVLSVSLSLDAPLPQTGGVSLMWVVTVNAVRFADGIHSWQLHASSTHRSIVVIPNDFLVARQFGLAQVGIEVATFEPGKALSLLIPRKGAIPELVVPGDTLEVHALWIQQGPLATVLVPEPAPASGAGGEAADPVAEATSCVPAQTVYALGDTLAHSFPLAAPADDASAEPGSARVALVCVRAGLADELVRYLYVEPDPVTGLVSYRLDTAGLTTGDYDLIVWVTPPGIAVHHRIELVSASP